MREIPESRADGSKIRVLVVHNRYVSGVPSAENNFIDNEVRGLRRAGVDVSTFFRSSDELQSMPISKRSGALISPITGTSSRRDFRRVLEAFRPDIVHLHNLYPLISPRVIDWCTDVDVPVIATMHNYRFQ